MAIHEVLQQPSRWNIPRIFNADSIEMNRLAAEIASQPCSPIEVQYQNIEQSLKSLIKSFELPFFSGTIVAKNAGAVVLVPKDTYQQGGLSIALIAAYPDSEKQVTLCMPERGHPDISEALRTGIVYKEVECETQEQLKLSIISFLMSDEDSIPAKSIESFYSTFEQKSMSLESGSSNKISESIKERWRSVMVYNRLEPYLRIGSADKRQLSC